MAHLIVDATGTRTVDTTVLVVAVIGSEDGLARTGLTAEHFAIYQVPDIAHGVPAACPIERVLEGPEGCYSLVLAPTAVAADGLQRRDIFSIAVHGANETGWADEHGMALAVSA